MSKDFFDFMRIALSIAVFIFGVTFGSVVLVASANAALAASLRSEAIITGDYIKLGDIFEGVENADYVLGPAPQPGKDMILNARTLYKIASALDIEWSPATSAQQIILRREAAVIPQSDIIATLEDRLRKEGVDEKFTVRLTTAPESVVLPAETPATMDITAFNFDPQRDSFNAVMVAPSGENPVKRISVSGSIERMVAVPVLKNSLKNGDIISALDIDWIDLPKNRIVAGTVMSEADLVNMSPRRMASAGKPINVNDLERPKMVDRGDSVTLIFDNGTMVLTTKGKALQAGAIGDSIRVANIDSNKSLQGVVTAHREVTIR